MVVKRSRNHCFRDHDLHQSNCCALFDLYLFFFQYFFNFFFFLINEDNMYTITTQ